MSFIAIQSLINCDKRQTTFSLSRTIDNSEWLAAAGYGASREENAAVQGNGFTDSPIDDILTLLANACINNVHDLLAISYVIYLFATA